jgi:hypothetical protein
MAELTGEVTRDTGEVMRMSMAEVFVLREGKIAERRAWVVPLTENDYRCRWERKRSPAFSRTRTEVEFARSTPATTSVTPGRPRARCTIAVAATVACPRPRRDSTSP